MEKLSRRSKAVTAMGIGRVKRNDTKMTEDKTLCDEMQTKWLRDEVGRQADIEKNNRRAQADDMMFLFVEKNELKG